MQKFVDVLSLNFRSAPEVTPDNKLGTLFLGTAVEMTGATDANGFVPVTAELDGKRVSGFVSGRYLRAPVSAPREALIGEAVAQWLRFARGLGKENIDPYFRYVGEMFRSINLKLDGRDRDVPWSAAFISFVTRRAGPAYAKFRFAAAHAQYINDSIKKRIAGKKDTPFWGFRLDERRPQLGDLICKWREHPVDYDTAARANAFKSHCDIVVSIDSANDTLLAIGGNVAQSVSVTTYKLTAGDFLADSDNVFALLANITDDG